MEELGSIPFIRDVAKKTDSTKYAMPALRFKTCRLLPGNVRNRELSLIQRRILRRLRNKRRSIKRNLSQRENLNSNIKSQTTRKLSLYYGDLPIREMHRGRERTSNMYSSLSEVSRLATKVWVCYMLSAPMRFILHFLLICCLFVFFGGNAQAAGEHMQPINPAEASVPAPESTGSMNALLDCIYLESGDSLYLESGDSSEPSVNQPAPDFLAVEQEQEAQRARLDEIRQLLLEQYRIVEWKKRVWMKNSQYPDLSDGVVEGVVRDLELYGYSSEALTEFIRDFKEDPKQFHPFFSFLYQKPK